MIRKQIILVISMVFLVLAVCSAAAAADVSDNGTAVQAQDQSHNSTSTNSIHTSTTNTNSSQSNTIMGSSQTNVANINSTQTDGINANSLQPDTTEHSSNESLTKGDSAQANTTQLSKVVISGQVKKCSNGEPFSGVTVTAQKNGTTLASTTTKEDGTYTLEFLSDDSVFNVTASYPGHKLSTKEVTVTADSNGTLQGTANFQLGPETFVDDDWVGLPAGTIVFFPGDPNPHTIGIDAFATISDGVTNTDSGGTLHIADGLYQGAANRGITLNNDINIIGQSQAGTIVDAEGADRIFTISAGVTVTIHDLTFTNGNAGNGGSIFNSGDLTVNECTFTDNSANNGGAIFNEGNLGVNGCTFDSNNAGSGGAIISTVGSTLNVENSDFNNNDALDFGGAISNGGTANIGNGSTFTGNTAEVGGAIYNTVSGTLNVENSTFSGNNVSDDGGAIYNEGNLNVTGSDFDSNTANNDGGAIWTSGGTAAIPVIVSGSTFTNNDAGIWGGAISNGDAATPGGTLTVTGSNFIGNNAALGGAIENVGTLTVENSNFDNNGATGLGGGAIDNVGVSLTVTGSNFVNNHSLEGGAIWSTGGDATNRNVHFNRIVGNSPANSEVHSDDGTLDARFNWWGSNDSPAGKISTSNGGVVLFDPWLILTITANPSVIFNGGTSQVTADLLHDSNGVFHDPALGHVPDGIPITLTILTWGSFTNPGNTDVIVLGTVNGAVTATYFANEGPTPQPPLNPVEITATADDETVSTFITILTPPSVITIGAGTSILGPSQNQIQNQAQTQTQTSINTNTNSLTNDNINVAVNSSSTANTNNISNVNIFNPVLILGNLNSV